VSANRHLVRFHYRLNKKSINYFECQLFTLNTLSEIPSRIFRNIFPKVRMASALTISIVADLLDYTAAPLLGMPIVGDVFDLIVMSLLYSITKSKVLFVMNLAEFLPFLGDFLPVYTASTIIWILRESGYDGLFMTKRLVRLLSNIQTHV
jgi:hypothetical protein